MNDADLKKVIETGTIKEKAIALCFEFLEEGKEDDEGAALIIASLADHTDEEKNEFSNWVYCYDIYCYMTPYFGLAYSEYTIRANQAAELLRKIDNSRRESKLLTDILSNLDGKARTTALELIKAAQYDDETFPTIEDDGKTVTLSTEQDERELQVTLKRVETNFASLKAVIEVFEEWGKRKGCRDIQPPYQVYLTKDAKGSYADELPTHSKRALKRREKKGEHITDEERAAAVFPDYDDIKAIPEIKRLTRKKFRYQEELVGDSIRFRTLVRQAKENKKKNTNK